MDKGDDNEFETVSDVYDTYGRMFEYIAFKLLKDKYMAEDAVQNCFYKLMKNRILEKIDDIHSEYAKNFLAKMIANEAKKILMAKQNSNFEYDECKVCEAITPYTVEMTVEEALTCREIIMMLNELPDIYSDVIIEHGLRGKTYKIIAEENGITTDAIKKRLQRGKQLLRDKLIESDKSKRF